MDRNAAAVAALLRASEAASAAAEALLRAVQALEELRASPEVDNAAVVGDLPEEVKTAAAAPEADIAGIVGDVPEEVKAAAAVEQRNLPVWEDMICAKRFASPWRFGESPMMDQSVPQRSLYVQWKSRVCVRK